jgi:predicted TIM-barrel fold metal-dependent hydrolase
MQPGREAIKNGFRVYDTDTHINPSAEVLDNYVDPDFRARIPELAPYRTPGGDEVQHNYRAGVKYYRRILGEAAPRETFTGRDAKWMGSKRPRPGTQDDNVENRVKDMDDEGTDVHFLIPTSWLSMVGVDDASIEIALIRAYHRHMAEFCAPYSDRLKGPIVASTRRVDEAVRGIREWGKAKWAVAVMPLLAEGLPADHPSLEPIWREAAGI